MKQDKQTQIDIFNSYSKSEQFLIFLNRNNPEQVEFKGTKDTVKENPQEVLTYERLLPQSFRCTKPISPCGLAVNLSFPSKIRQGIPPLPSGVLVASQRTLISQTWIGFVKESLKFALKFDAKKRAEAAGPHFCSSLLEGPLARMVAEQSQQAYEQFLDSVNKNKMDQSAEIIAWAKKILASTFENPNEILEAFFIENPGQDSIKEMKVPNAYEKSTHDFSRTSFWRIPLLRNTGDARNKVKSAVHEKTRPSYKRTDAEENPPDPLGTETSPLKIDEEQKPKESTFKDSHSSADEISHKKRKTNSESTTEKGGQKS